MIGEDAIPAKKRKGTIQLTDILSAEKYAEARFILPPLLKKEDGSRMVYRIDNGKEKYVLKIFDIPLEDADLLKRVKGECQKTRDMGETCLHFIKVIDMQSKKLGSSTRVEILLEYGGQNIFELANKGATKKEITMWIMQSVIAFRYCEARRICHLDIKPENMVFMDNILRIIDLGIAIEFERKDEVAVPLGNNAEKFGGFTRSYSPPEILRYHDSIKELKAQCIGSKVDVYCWGMTFYQLLAGISPVDMGRFRDNRVNIGKSEYEEGFIEQVKADPKLIEFDQRVNMADIIAACLCYNPAERCTFEKLENWLEPMSDSAYSNRKTVVDLFFGLGLYYDKILDNKHMGLHYIRKSLKFMSETELRDPFKLFQIGEVYTNAGKTHEASEYYKKALYILKEALGLSHTDDADAYQLLGKIYNGLGDSENSIASFLNAIKIAEHKLGPEHPETARLYYQVGSAYRSASDNKEAISCMLKALKAKERMPNYEVCTIYASLGILHDLIEEWGTALQYFLKALPGYEDTFGVEHSKTGDLYGYIGLDYGKTGDKKKAEEYLNKAADNYEKSNKPDDELAADIYLHLEGNDPSLDNKPKDAENCAALVKSYEAQYGRDSPEVAAVYCKLGKQYKDQKDYENALKCHIEAQRIREKALGPRHSDTGNAYLCIGQDFACLGKHSEALTHLLHAEEVFKSFPKRNELAEIYNAIGDANVCLNKKDDAITYYKKVADFWKRVRGSADLKTATAYRVLGDVLGTFKNYKESIGYYNMALVVMQKKLGLRHPNTAKTYRSAGLCLCHMFKSTQALPYFIKALAYYENAEDEEASLENAQMYDNLGRACIQEEQKEKSFKYLKKALEIRRELLGPMNLDIGRAYRRLAGACRAFKEYEDALIYYKEAQNILENTVGADNSDTADVYECTGLILAGMGEVSQSLLYLFKALHAYTIAEGPMSLEVATVCKSIAGVYLSLMEKENTLRYFRKHVNVSERSDDPTGLTTAYAYCRLGQACRTFGSYEEALTYHTSALDIFKQKLGPDHPTTIGVCDAVADEYSRLGDSAGVQHAFERMNISGRTVARAVKAESGEDELF
ncbi:MAG: tetratricopeptide repeat-containing serine/threonine-protein kinase [Desulfosporosinus sp.]|nr:tetratricopeptide repeat-containing serine/threonine-protein kinase [Desulfosporosinus sp.]